MKIREYSGPLTVLAAGVLGFSLICIVSAAALANPRTSPVSEIGAQEIVDSAFSNPINTAAALTAVEISEYIPTATSTFSETATLSPSVTPSLTATIYTTPTRHFVTWTPLPPPRTRERERTPTNTPIPSRTPSKTPSRTPTKTLVPSPTNTRPPTFTFTPRPTATDIFTLPAPTATQPPTGTEPPTASPAPTGTPVPTSTPVVIETATTDGIILSGE